MNSVEENNRYFESNHHKEWLNFDITKPKQPEIGYWVCFIEYEAIHWVFKQPQ
jgi:hypothetical protein